MRFSKIFKIKWARIIALITVETKRGTKIKIDALDLLAMAFIIFFITSFALSVIGWLEEKWLYFWAGASIPSILKFFVREHE